MSAEPPDRHAGGGGIRQSYLLECLAHRHQVDVLLAGGTPDAVVADVINDLSVVAHPHRWTPPSRSLRRATTLADSLLPGGPFERRDNSRVRRTLRQALLERSGYDVVCVEHAGLAPLVAERRAGEAWILTMHNVPSITATQMLRRDLRRRDTWVWRRELVAARRLERAALKLYDVVAVSSHTDAQALPGSTVVVPNGVDTQRLTPTPLPPEPRLIFTGSLNYRPNVEGLTWFCREVYPAVQDRLPQVQLDIVGRQPVADVSSLAGPSVNVYADVPDIQPFLERARVAVIPLLSGSGTRLKALEAMAAGRPVVGTGVGLAGLEIVHDQHAVIQDAGEALAAAVASLLPDDAKCERLAEAGRALAVEKFDWHKIADEYAGIVEQMRAHTP